MDTEHTKQEENKALHIGVVVCSSCGKDIKSEDDKHCFWDEDIENSIKPECLDYHLDRESIIRDFGF